jgi:hypothetical protein
MSPLLSSPTKESTADITHPHTTHNHTTKNVTPGSLAAAWQQRAALRRRAAWGRRQQRSSVAAATAAWLWWAAWWRWWQHVSTVVAAWWRQEAWRRRRHLHLQLNKLGNVYQLPRHFSSHRESSYAKGTRTKQHCSQGPLERASLLRGMIPLVIRGY